MLVEKNVEKYLKDDKVDGVDAVVVGEEIYIPGEPQIKYL
jgi:hypothetical protein